MQKQIQPAECEACGVKIPKARLKAIPGARYCVKCADRYGDIIIDVELMTAQSSLDNDNFSYGE